MRCDGACHGKVYPKKVSSIPIPMSISISMSKSQPGWSRIPIQAQTSSRASPQESEIEMHIRRSTANRDATWQKAKSAQARWLSHIPLAQRSLEQRPSLMTYFVLQHRQFCRGLLAKVLPCNSHSPTYVQDRQTDISKCCTARVRQIRTLPSTPNPINGHTTNMVISHFPFPISHIQRPGSIIKEGGVVDTTWHMGLHCSTPTP